MTVLGVVLKKSHLLSFVAINLAFLFLLACGDDSSSSASTNANTSSNSNDLGGEPPAENVDKPSFSHTPGFNPCQFNFGAAWQAAHEDAEFYKGVDYIAVWLGDNDFYNAFEARMVETSAEIGATPMIYGYVIAEFGKDMGLEDCDVAKKNETSLCVGGANLIREYFTDSILYRYREYAMGMRDQVEGRLEQNPDTYESIWMVEPDFYQYSESGSNQKASYDSIAQLGGGIPDAEMGLLFRQIVDTIRTYLPAAKIAIDVSPWVLDQAAWFANFDLSVVDYVSTSGGRTLAGSEKIRSGNIATWKQIHEITGKPILADAGYDAGGKGTGHAVAWDKPENINARIENGVVGVMQMDAALDYPARLDTIRPQITAKIPGCEE